MSKSVARVRRALAEAGLEIEPVETGNATTSQMAADLLGCDVAQIAKSIMFRDESGGDAILFDQDVGGKGNGAVFGIHGQDLRALDGDAHWSSFRTYATSAGQLA